MSLKDKIKNTPLPNIRFGTMGGHYRWNDIRSSKNFILQQLKLTSHCRIIEKSGKNYRIANGSKESMMTVFKRLEFQEEAGLNIAPKHLNRLSKRRWTMGGKYCWTDIDTRNGYRIQENIFFGNCRILDMRNNHIDSGDRFEMKKVLDELIKVESVIKFPAYGDIIGVERIGGIYDHYGVYVDDSCVIEFSSEEGDFGTPVIHQTTFSKFISNSKKVFVLIFLDKYGIPGKLYFSPNVEITPQKKQSLFAFLSEFVNNINLDTEKYLNYVEEALDSSKYYHNYSPDETVKRAKECIGKTYFGNGDGAYALHRNNCEHFVFWCKTGLRQSVQTEGKFMKAIREFDTRCNEA